jgi:hypothetical protein
MSTVAAPSGRIAKQRSLKTLAVNALADTVKQQAAILNYLGRLFEDSPVSDCQYDDVDVYRYDQAVQAFALLNNIRDELEGEIA